MTRQPSTEATAALALQAATAEQLEQAQVELQRRKSSLAVTSHLADIMADELAKMLWPILTATALPPLPLSPPPRPLAEARSSRSSPRRS